jgi:hypothetical protein
MQIGMTVTAAIVHLSGGRLERGLCAGAYRSREPKAVAVSFAQTPMLVQNSAFVALLLPANA